MIVTCRQMQEAEARLFATGQPAEPLMDLAGQRCAAAVRQCFPSRGRAILFCGKGNNGGDAIVIGSWLRKWGWEVETRFSHSVGETTDLARKKFREFQGIPDGGGGDSLVIVDGLLGIGATGALRGKIGESAAELNRLRIEWGGVTFAVDIPSGVDGDTGEPYENAVIADHTLSICSPKRGVIDQKATNHVGRIHHIPLPEIPVTEGDQSLRLLSPENLKNLLPRRQFDTHKGTAGRVSIIAGSRGLTGAAVLSSLGAISSGAGLTTVFVPEDVYSIVASKAPVEAMVRPYSPSIREIIDHPTDVYAIGPGLGSQINRELLDFAVCQTKPIVADADLLNWIAADKSLLEKMSSHPRLLTPHPGELARLCSDPPSDRIEAARSLSAEWNCSLLYKGARSVIATPGEVTNINSSGSPQMASGGMGDVLTGMTAALIGQGLSLHAAASLGSWCLGQAAEICSPGVTASKVAEQLGTVLESIRSIKKN